MVDGYPRHSIGSADPVKKGMKIVMKIVIRNDFVKTIGITMQGTSKRCRCNV